MGTASFLSPRARNDADTQMQKKRWSVIKLAFLWVRHLPLVAYRPSPHKALSSVPARQHRYFGLLCVL